VKSKRQTSLGMSFDISRMETCLPMQVREPMPNYVGESLARAGDGDGVSLGGKFLLWTIDGKNQV
jgi:hypothetical protein